MSPLDDVRPIWIQFAEARRLRYVAEGAAGLPSLEGRRAGTDVVISAVDDAKHGFRTRATTKANIPLKGNVRVGPAGRWRSVVGRFIGLRLLGDSELDRLFHVRMSSEALARTVLDARVLETVRALAPGRLELSYAGGAIAIEWAGLERSHAVLDDVLDALAHLAVRGSEETPYR